jgi:hypothetical protein
MTEQIDAFADHGVPGVSPPVPVIMPEPGSEPKQKKLKPESNRKVFARIRVRIGGKEYISEQTRVGIVVHQFRSKKRLTVSWQHLLDAAEGQFRML